MTFAALSGVGILTASIVVPLVGAWSGDVALVTDDTIPVTVQLTLGDLVLNGAIVRQGSTRGIRRLRLVGGAGGWRNVVSPRQYQHSYGITRAMVITDAAREVGESVGAIDDAPIGSDYVRASTGGLPLRASDVLRTWAPAWYIDKDGVTQCQAWPVSPVMSAFQVIDHDTAAGHASLSTENYADWFPGRTFSSPFSEGAYRNVASRFNLDEEGRLRVDVLTVPA